MKYKTELKVWATSIGLVLVVVLSIFSIQQAFFPEADGMWTFRKYCPQCETQMWTKPGTYLHCPECGYQFFKTHDELSNHLNETQIP